MNTMIPSDIQNTLEWLIQIEEYSQARDLAFTAARFLPSDNPEVSDFLAMVLHRTKHYREALIYAKKTAELLPDRLEVRYNLSRCLNSAGFAVEAEQQIRPVVEMRPDWLDPQLDLAMYICFQGRFEESEKILLDLQKKWPSDHVHQVVIQFNLALHLIRRGQLKKGLHCLSMGRKLRKFGFNPEGFSQPKLQPGFSVAGKKILIVGEAGAGDEIINVRFAEKLKARGAHCIWRSGQKLESLFLRASGVSKTLNDSQLKDLQYDFWVPAMDLFVTLDLDESDLRPVPYLTAHSDFLEKWRARIQPNDHLKIGLRWQGNPLYEQDLFRSVPFDLYRKFFAIEKADFYSLQRDSGLEELSTADPVVDLSKDLTSWEDTAAAISLMDVVVTSCTSIAHLAGALGKKTLLFTPMVPYYIWASPGKKSIWYSDVTLFRQKKYHDWSSEAEEVFQELKGISK